MSKNKKTAHYFLIALAALTLSAISLFTPFSTVIAQPATAEETNPSTVQFSWQMNVSPIQVGNIQLLVNGTPIYNSNNPPPTSVVEFSYSSSNQHYNAIYHSQLEPGTHNWQVKVFNQEGQLLSSTQPEDFRVQDPNRANQGRVTEAVTGYQNFMNETKIGDMTVTEVSEKSLLSLSAISAIFYGVVLLIQVSYILPMGIFAQILKALGLFKAGEEPLGFVFNSKTYEPIPFAVLTMTRLDDKKSFVDDNYHETIVSGTDGIYRGVNLPVGQYRIKIEKEGFSFPTKQKRAPFLTINDYYKGEVFNVGSTHVSQQMLIPMDEIGLESLDANLTSSEAVRLSRKHRRQNWWQVFSKGVIKVLNKLMILFWLFSIMVLVASPSNWINWVVFGIYTVIVGVDFIKALRRPRLQGLVTDENAQPLADCLVRLSTVENHQLVGISSTDKKGRYRFFVKKDVYQLSAYYNGRILKQDSPFTLTEVDLTKKALVNDIVMEPVSQNLGDYFSQKTDIQESESIPSNPAEPEPEIKYDEAPPADQIPDFNRDQHEAGETEQAANSPTSNENAAPEQAKTSADEIPSFDAAALLKSQFGKK